MIQNRLKIRSVGYFHDMPYHMTRRNKPIDYLVIHVVGGQGWARTEQQQWQLTPGTLISFRKGQPHAYGSSENDPWAIYWAHFTGSDAPQLIHRFRRHGVRISLGVDPVLTDLAVRMTIHHAQHGERRPMTTAALCYTWLAAMIEQLEDAKTHAEQNDRFDLSAVQRYVHQNLTQQIDVQTLANLAHLSVSQFNRLFQRRLGISPMQYVIRQRLARACTLLHETHMPIHQIAVAVGYDDPYYFSRLFRKVLKTTPSSYRSHDDVHGSKTKR